MSDTAPEKPPVGHPCNGCGFCCASEPCLVSQGVFGIGLDYGPCPALEWGEGRFWCGLLRSPEAYGMEGAEPLLRQLLGVDIGAGCDASMDHEPDYSGPIAA